MPRENDYDVHNGDGSFEESMDEVGADVATADRFVEVPRVEPELFDARLTLFTMVLTRSFHE